MSCNCNQVLVIHNNVSLMAVHNGSPLSTCQASALSSNALCPFELYLNFHSACDTGIDKLLGVRRRPPVLCALLQLLEVKCTSFDLQALHQCVQTGA